QIAGTHKQDPGGRCDLAEPFKKIESPDDVNVKGQLRIGLSACNMTHGCQVEYPVRPLRLQDTAQCLSVANIDLVNANTVEGDRMRSGFGPVRDANAFGTLAAKERCQIGADEPTNAGNQS